MIQRDRAHLQMVCDECEDELPDVFPEGEFQEMVEDAKRKGWSIRPDDEGEWVHECPSCAGTSESPLARQRRLLGL